MVQQLTSDPMFGFTLTLAVFLFFRRIEQTRKIKWLNPLAFSIVTIILLLNVFNVSYEDYFVGAKYVDMFIAPATVALAIPLYRSLHLIKKHSLSIMVGIGVGSLLNILMVLGLAFLFKLDKVLAASLVPKSVTTAIAMDLSTQMGGVAAITVLAVIITGVFAPLMAIPFLQLFSITDPIAQGLALGTTSHAIGTSTAMEMGEIQGAMSGLAIGLAGIATVVFAPISMELANVFLFT
ncbi:LrgB family protein [Vagococcus elongatus]|uniref:Murein hydrolase effector protein LrgB n=1 Tax=Vagococcus elongatus TaxID=180344 RepID=A0A430B410_9ENTE|nr:LrgB family protein [Vagococcus elongatus]RSU15053.1 hypothetical protein CBF29_01565 [Vagococcus elongatus]